jgi:hypothetical protein
MSNLRVRLRRLETARARSSGKDLFPGWGVLSGDCELANRWLAQRGHADLVAAVAAGESGPLLHQLARDEWLRQQGYADADAALEAGATPPRGLEAEFRERAAADYYHEVYRYLMYHLVPGPLAHAFATLRHQIQDHGREAPWIELLPELQQVAFQLRDFTAGESRRLYREHLRQIAEEPDPPAAPAPGRDGTPPGDSQATGAARVDPGANGAIPDGGTV